jgi:2-polyprenyl-3-methyl-5-hydroxy-6-metoxy-1,4-benzoquinol methylase
MSGQPVGPEQQSVYILNERPEVAPFIPGAARTALDVGCGRGGFGDTLRRKLGPDARIVGIEPVAEQAAIARDHGFDEVVSGYFPDAPEELGRFDLITFNDVLEHMVDPWQALHDTRRWLTPAGVVLACIPNIQYWPAVIDLANGRWDYADAGLLDRTHLRFFTRKTMCDMFEATGYEVVECQGVNSVWGSEWRPSGHGMSAKVRNVTRGLLTRARPDGAFLHFVVVARPTANGGSAG